MREVVLVMPCNSTPQRRACTMLESAILGLAGGFTRLENALGAQVNGWENADGDVIFENVLRYVVGVNDSGVAARLREALVDIGTKAGEQSVYFVDMNGEASVIPCREVA